MSRLQGKVAVITGGSSGIGLATARRFVKEGAYVYIVGRRQAELDRAREQIGGNVSTIQGDVRKLEDLDRLYARVQSEKGKIDILVANSGVVEPQKFAETTESNFDNTFGVNVRGLLFTVQKALPIIRDGGAVVVISSIAAFKGIAGYTTYSASKASVRSFVRTWTVELKERGIRVNAISPGPIDTPIMESQATSTKGSDEIRASFAAAVPLSRLGRPEELASAILFLASDESSYVAGADLVVDGGLSAV